MSKKIAIIGTLDTKADEISYLKKQIKANSCDVIVIDVGVIGATPFVPEINREQVADASGMTIQDIASLNDEAKAMNQMAKGAIKITKELHSRDQLDGILAIGGTIGTDLALDVMNQLPIGLPKLIISSIAFSHLLPPDRVSADLMMILWAAGLWGINSISIKVLDTAVGAIVGAALRYKKEVVKNVPKVAVTSLGQSTLKYLRWIKPSLEKRGYEVIVFHTVGMGGRAMESLIGQGVFCAVLDLCAIEVSDHILGSVVSAGNTRLEAAGKMGIPQIVAPGSIDGLDWATWAKIPEDLQNRPFHVHNKLISVAKTTNAERELTGKVIAKKLNKAKGPTAVVIPLKGFEEWDKPGTELYDSLGSRAFIRGLKAYIKPKIKVVELDCHINDKRFSDTVLKIFDEIVPRL
jgi:uncharacterized protein (UPF0261 family)